MLETHYDLQSERLRMQLEMERKLQTAQIEAEEMRLKGYNQKDVMQADVQNQGYAAGIAAAMAVGDGCSLRRLDLAELQRRLVEKEILPAESAGARDGVAPGGNVPPDMERLARLFLRPDKARREVKVQFMTEPQLETAQILAFFGDSTGRDFLRAALAGRDWDEGWDFRGMGQFGASVSPIDCTVFALRSIGAANPEIISLLSKLEPGSSFSHFRAIAMYLMRWPVPEAAPMLERLMECPGFTGNHIGTLADAMRSNRPERNDNSVRNRQLKEIYTAAALFCCAPGNSRACAVLEAYRDGMNGLYSRFAAGVLKRR